MELTYHLERYEGPLDLLLQLIQKNKMNILDIQVGVICDQYLEYIEQAEAHNMELASEFIDMASELVLLKSRMLIPRIKPDEPDPREDFAENLLRYQQAKAAAALLAKRYEIYRGRMEKDTDEITIDKTFVSDQDVTELCLGIRRILSYLEEKERTEKEQKIRFTPLVSAPIVSVEVKIAGIYKHIKRTPKPSMRELLTDAKSLPELIAIFLGILELVRMQRLIIVNEDGDTEGEALAQIHDLSTTFTLNENAPTDIEMSDTFTTHPVGDSQTIAH